MEFMIFLDHPILVEVADVVFIAQRTQPGHHEDEDEEHHADVHCALSCLSDVRDCVQIIAVHHIVTQSPLNGLAEVIVEQQVLLF